MITSLHVVFSSHVLTTMPSADRKGTQQWLLCCEAASKRVAQRKKHKVVIIFCLEQIFPEIQEEYTLDDTAQSTNEDCHLSPVQQFHLSLVTWIPLCFGFASACAPICKHRKTLFLQHFTKGRLEVNMKSSEPLVYLS